MPGTMRRTRQAETRMKAWSPDWYHWFRFSFAVDEKDKKSGYHVLHGLLRVCSSGLLKLNILESPPIESSVPLKAVGGPT